MKIERLKLCLQLDQLKEQRCSVCAESEVPIEAPCCDANVQIRQIGDELLKLTKPRTEKDNELYKEERRKWRKIAVTNGITKWQYDYRVRQRGMTPEAAATTPEEQIESTSRRGQVFPKKQREIAKRNGISVANVYNRLRNGWDLERAITEPLKQKRGKSK